MAKSVSTFSPSGIPYFTMRAIYLHSKLLLVSLFALACSPLGDHPAVIFDGDDFFGQPWPDDNRTNGGRPDMDGFPQRGELDLIESYMVQIEELDGFGTNSPLYIPLEFRPEALPKISETTTTDGPLWLIDIDPHSPERGTLVPVQVEYQSEETLWQRADLMAVQPVWGFPLRPRTTYALVLTTDFVRPVDDWRSLDTWSALDAVLLERRVDVTRIAYAVQFTTQDSVGEMARFEERIAVDLETPSLRQNVQAFQRSDLMTAYEGKMWVPIWQHGDKPYFSSGGEFRFDEANMPILADWEQVNFTLSIPNGDAPPNGWPVTIYAHGTGGNNRGFANSIRILEPANVLADVGIAGFGISLPLHGDRSTNIDPALASFNYLNPDSARSVFRQGALDQLYLAEILTKRQHEFDLPNGTTTKLDPENVAYMGHSHGGLVGAIAGPFFGERLKGIFLSGAGGGLSTTVVTRDAGDFDIQGLLKTSLNFSSDDKLVESHPVIAMVQMLGEVTDPINYAPYWNHRAPFWDTTPISVLMTEGLNDIQTPPDTAEALAAAGRLPLLAPAAHVSDAHQLQNEGTERSPTTKNRAAWDGSRVTAGLAQYPNEDHFAIFNNEEAARLYQQFLISAMEDGVPMIPKQEP